jgi:hypothetical protein
MSEFEEEDINKMFSEIMNSAAINPKEKIDDESIFSPKYLLVIQESLMDCLLSINSMLYRSHTDQHYSPPEETEQFLGALYQASEDFFVYMSKNDDIMNSLEIELHLLGEDEDDDYEEED